jgi:hypothetical protein
MLGLDEMHSAKRSGTQGSLYLEVCQGVFALGLAGIGLAFNCPSGRVDQVGDVHTVLLRRAVAVRLSLFANRLFQAPHPPILWRKKFLVAAHQAFGCTSWDATVPTFLLEQLYLLWTRSHAKVVIHRQNDRSAGMICVGTSR